MSAPIRMVTLMSILLSVIIGTYYIFTSTSYDNQRSSAVRQIATTNLSRKSVRSLPKSQNASNQQTLSRFSLDKDGNLDHGWTTSNSVNAYEQSVWTQIYNKYQNHMNPDIKLDRNVNDSYGQYKTITRTRTWYKNGVSKGTIFFTYLVKNNMSDVYAVKVTTMINGRSYSTNNAIIHDSNDNAYGEFSNTEQLTTPRGSVTSDDQKSGENIDSRYSAGASYRSTSNRPKAFTTDAGYNVVWDSEFTQPLKHGMDHIKLTYTFNQYANNLMIPSALGKIYNNNDNNLPVTVLRSTDAKTSFNINRDQVKITNGTNSNPTAKVVITLTENQSVQFLNLAYSTQEKLLFRVTTHVRNDQLTSDYATAQATMETLSENNNVLETQTTNMSGIRIAPFAVQSIDTKSSIEDAKATLGHYVNKLYPNITSFKNENASKSSSQYQFAQDGNTAIKN